MLTINGDYTQNASGTLTIDVTPTQASELKVNGQASLAGTLNLIYAPGTYAEHTYTLVQANALTGRFATTTASGAPAALIPDVVYGSTAVYLALATVHPADGALYGNLQQVASLANQQTLGAVLDAALGSAESAMDEAAMVPPAATCRWMVRRDSTARASACSVVSMLPWPTPCTWAWRPGSTSAMPTTASVDMAVYRASMRGFMPLPTWGR